jgi:hypothetical protein
MKKTCALILLFMLSLPCAAQAYYFEVTYFNSTSDALSNNASWDTHGDQVDFVANGMDSDSSYSGQVTAQFVLYSDYGRNIVTGVNATLTDISNYFAYTPDTPYLSVTSTFDLSEPMGEWVSVLSDTYSEEITAGGSSLSATSLEYYDLMLITGMTYQLVFTYESMSTGPFSTANREISIDINQEDMPTPIPGAVWLLGTGLVGLVGLRRKLA